MATEKCPRCKREHFYYVQDVTEYHTIDEVYEDGNVDVMSHARSYNHDTYKLWCEDCEWEGTAEDFVKMKED